MRIFIVIALPLIFILCLIEGILHYATSNAFDKFVHKRIFNFQFMLPATKLICYATSDLEIHERISRVNDKWKSYSQAIEICF